MTGIRRLLGVTLCVLSAASCGDAKPSGVTAADAATQDAAVTDSTAAADGPDAAAGDAASEDAAAPDASQDATEDIAEVFAGAAFGELCSTKKPKVACAPGLFCLSAPTGKSFCSKTCPSQGKPCEGAPEATAAFCVVTDVNAAGDGGCAFVCATKGGKFDCPADLTCQTSQEPPGSGQQLCFPE